MSNIGWPGVVASALVHSVAGARDARMAHGLAT